MDIATFEEVVPRLGTLSARVFENENIGLEPTLFFDIEIPLQPFQFKGEEVSTSVCLQFIQIPVKNDWREIAGQTYPFPVNPEDGYIDGSIYLDNAHNPADAARLTFGQLEAGQISCKILTTFDFTYEGPEELGTPTVEWDIRLALNEEQLDRVMTEAR